MSATELHEEEALGKAYDARLMKRLLRYLKPYWWLVLLAILILMLASATQIVGPWLTQLALDRAVPRGDTTFLAILAGAYLASVAVGFFLQYGQALITTWLGQSVMYDLRAQIFEKLQYLDLRFHDRNPVGRLMTRITSDVEKLPFPMAPVGALGTMALAESADEKEKGWKWRVCDE